jgi:hypothetical protein
VAKQVLWANGTSYLLHEIFGIDRNPDIDPGTTDESGNKVVEQPCCWVEAWTPVHGQVQICCYLGEPWFTRLL